MTPNQTNPPNVPGFGSCKAALYSVLPKPTTIAMCGYPISLTCFLRFFFHPSCFNIFRIRIGSHESRTKMGPVSIHSAASGWICQPTDDEGDGRTGHHPRLVAAPPSWPCLHTRVPPHTLNLPSPIGRSTRLEDSVSHTLALILTYPHTLFRPLINSACYGYSICLPGVLSESVACVQQLSSFPAFLLAWVGLVYLCTARYR